MKTHKFKQTEIGEIPDNWDVDKLKNHLIIKGRIGWKGLKVSEYIENGPFIVGGLQIKNNGVAWKECAHVTEERYRESPEIMLHEKDILMTKDGTIGKLAYIRELPHKATVASHIHVIRKKTENVIPEFLFYFFKTPIFEALVDSKISGSVVPALTQQDINNTYFPIPPLKEQKIITKILSDLDEKIELNRKMNKTLKAIGQALFKRWFVDFEFPDENGEPYKSSGGEMVDSELGEIPKRWEQSEIGKQVIVKGGTTPSTKNADYWENGNVAWCTPKDLSNLTSPVLLDTERKITKAGLSTISSGLLPAGTLLLSSRAPIGYVAISEIPVSINQGFIAILCESKVSNYFMLYWINNNLAIIKNMAGGSTFQEINKASFREINLLLPALDVLSSFDEIIKTIYERIVINERESHNLSTIRDSLLPRLMSGRIRVVDSERQSFEEYNA